MVNIVYLWNSVKIDDGVSGVRIGGNINPAQFFATYGSEVPHEYKWLTIDDRGDAVLHTDMPRRVHSSLRQWMSDGYSAELPALLQETFVHQSGPIMYKRSLASKGDYFLDKLTHRLYLIAAVGDDGELAAIDILSGDKLAVNCDHIESTRFERTSVKLERDK